MVRPFHARPLFGIAPGGACRASPVASPAVGSYPTVSPLPWIRRTQLPGTMADFSLWRFPWGCPRRALPGTLPSWSPDFPRGLHPAVIQPSAQGGRYGEWGRASSPKAAGVGGGGLASGAPRPGLRCLRREYLGQDEIGSVSADQAWPNSCARCWAKARSVASSGPVAQGRKRRRKAARRMSAGASG